MKVKAAVARAKSAPLTIETLDLEEPRAGEILVRLIAAGICHTDLAMRDQVFPVPQPIVLGHEGAGIVERVGSDVTKVVAGDHVVMTYNSCGRCPSCLEHEPTYCHDFFSYNFAAQRPDGSTALSQDGQPIHSHFFGQSSFATYALCLERNVVKVPHDAPLELLGPLACGVQTGAGAVINALRVGAGRSIAVFGTGSVGLSAIIAARLVGAAVIIGVDLNDARLALARELGATHTVNAANEDAVAAITRITGFGVNYTLETTAVPQVIRRAVESLAPRGACGLIGASPVGAEMSLDILHLMTAGRQVRGIVEGDSKPEVFIPALINLYRQGRFPFDRMVKFYNLDNINDAIKDSEAGACIKPILRMQATTQ